jgi:hypothetical protein
VEEFGDLRAKWCEMLEKNRTLKFEGCGTQLEKYRMNTNDNRPEVQGGRSGKTQGIVVFAAYQYY